MDKKTQARLIVIQDLKDTMTKENAKRFKKPEEEKETKTSGKTPLAVRIMALKG